MDFSGSRSIKVRAAGGPAHRISAKARMTQLRTKRAATAIAVAIVAGALWWRRNPSACPYGQRFWVQTPHPFITRARLQSVLQPQDGSRILEIGPGTGYYTLHAAMWVGGAGRVDIVDVQQPMLDHVMRRAAAAGARNVYPARSDARELPYPDDTFDAAYLVAVLGEIPDRIAALRELARVVRPGGNVVVGELFGDPHWVSPSTVRREGATAGPAFVRTERRLLGHYTLLSAPEGPT